MVQLPAAQPPGLHRRSFLKATAGVVGAAAVGVSLTGCDVVADTADPDLHLLERATFGVSTSSLTRLRTIGRAAWLDEQLDPGRLDLRAIDAKVAMLPDLAASAAQLKATYQGTGAAIVGAQLQLATLMRQVESPAQLHERMVELWSDHFNVARLDEHLRSLKPVEDREVIRPRAMGTFRELLLASAQSPAMLVYLDGARSFAGAINENYGRELLELHTVGVDGGYTEDDVVGAARLLTGWTVSPQTGRFVFDVARHDAGPLTIMGWNRPSGGDPFAHGRQFLSWLAAHPSTAHHVCTKIARRFVADRPDAGLVDAMAATYRANDTAIVPVLRTMFGHPAFAAAVGQKFRRPNDWFAAACRATAATLTPSTARAPLQGAAAVVFGLGQPPHMWPAPNGYPDVEGAWRTSGGLLARWNAGGDLVRNAIPLVRVDTAPLQAGLAGRTIEAALDLLADRVLHRRLTDDGRHVLRAHTGLQPATVVNDPLAYLLVPRIVPLLLATGDVQYR